MKKEIRELIPNNLQALKELFSSLRSRNYRLYFMGQCISVTGTWIQQIAMSWLIYRLTGSVVLLATVNLMIQLPSLLIAPFSGVLIDRMNRHRLLVITQICFMFEALFLAILMFTGLIQVWHIVALGLFAGITNAVDAPTRQSLVLELVDHPRQLSNAIALNSAVFNGARLLGPSIGGIIISLLDEGMCFLLNGLSYIATISALLMMKLKSSNLKQNNINIFAALKEGLAYVGGYLPLRALLLMIAVISFFGIPFLVIVPAYVREVLQGDSRTLGFLLGSFGAGALLAAMYLAARKSVLGLAKVITICSALFGAGLMAIACITNSWIAFLVAFPTGFGFIAAVSSINTLLQTLADNDKRGRVMSFYSMSFIGMAPLGSMLFSFFETAVGLSYSVLLMGAICILAAFVFERFRPVIRRLSHPAFVRKGIVPEIAKGLQASNQLIIND